jgi:hypothetical protein
MPNLNIVHEQKLYKNKAAFLPAGLIRVFIKNAVDMWF